MPLTNTNINKLNQEKELQGYKQLLCSRLGDGWSEPCELKTFPHFIVKSRDVKKKRENKNKKKRGDLSEPTVGKGDEGERKLLSAVKKLIQLDNCPHGYFISDTELEGYEDTSLQIDAILVSPHGIVVFEAKQYDNVREAVVKGEEQLDKRVQAVEDILEKKISVRGAIVLPFKEKNPKQDITSRYDILYSQDLEEQRFSHYLNHNETVLDTSKEDKEKALAKILTLTFLREDYPSTEEEAIHLEAQKIFYCKGRKYNGSFKTPSFNSIILTNEQRENAKLMQGKNTVINGPYGCGKTITIIKAIQNKVKHLGKGDQLKILFLSGQLAFNSNKEAHYLPFLNIIKALIEEALSGYTYVIKGYNENTFHDERIPIFIELCLLSEELLAGNITALPLTDYDVFILEETNALTETEMNTCIKCFKGPRATRSGRKRYPVTWVTTSMSASELLQKYPVFKGNHFTQIHVSDTSMRNTSEIISFANSVESYIAPECFPSSKMSVNNTPEGIPISYFYDKTDELVIDEIAFTVERWLVVPGFVPSQLLIIDTESDGQLLSIFKSKGISLRENYSESKHHDAPLFLQASKDPIESIVAGGEWAALILYFKYETVMSQKAVHLFNKRIISRAKAKIYLFSDHPVDEAFSERNVTGVNSDESKSIALLSDKNSVTAFSTGNESLDQKAEIKEPAKKLTCDDVKNIVAFTDLFSTQRYHFLCVKKRDNVLNFDLLNFAAFHETGNAAFYSYKDQSDVWLIQHHDDLHTVYLVSTSESTDALKSAQNYFLDKYNVKLPVICKDPEFRDENGDLKDKNWRMKASRINLLINTFTSRRSLAPVRNSRWIEVSGHSGIEMFLEALKRGKL